MSKYESHTFHSIKQASHAYHVNQLAHQYHSQRLEMAEKVILENANNGELWAIKAICSIIADAVDDGCQIPPAIAKYLADALHSIHASGSADTAFKIQRVKGESDRTRAHARGYAMTDYGERLRILEKITVDESNARTADLYCVSIDTVKRNRKINLKEVKRLLTLEKSTFGKIKPIGNFHPISG